MATQLAKVVANGADIDAIAGQLEGQINITDAVVIGHYESDGLTYPGTERCDGQVLIKITGTTDAAITTAAGAIAASASISLMTNAEAALDAEA